MQLKACQYFRSCQKWNAFQNPDPDGNTAACVLHDPLSLETFIFVVIRRNFTEKWVSFQSGFSWACGLLSHKESNRHTSPLSEETGCRTASTAECRAVFSYSNLAVLRILYKCVCLFFRFLCVNIMKQSHFASWRHLVPVINPSSFPPGKCRSCFHLYISQALCGPLRDSVMRVTAIYNTKRSVADCRSQNQSPWLGDKVDSGGIGLSRLLHRVAHG